MCIANKRCHIICCLLQSWLTIYALRENLSLRYRLLVYKTVLQHWDFQTQVSDSGPSWPSSLHISTPVPTWFILQSCTVYCMFKDFCQWRPIFVVIISDRNYGHFSEIVTISQKLWPFLRNYYLFSEIVTISQKLWPFLRNYDHFSEIMTFSQKLWPFLRNYDHFSEIVTISQKLWPFLRNDDNFSELMTISQKLWSFLKSCDHFSEIMTISNNGIQCQLVPLMLPIFHVLKMSFAYYICCVYLNALESAIIMAANTMNPDQTAP